MKAYRFCQDVWACYLNIISEFNDLYACAIFKDLKGFKQCIRVLNNASNVILHLLSFNIVAREQTVTAIAELK